MQPNEIKPPTFADKFCAVRGLPPEKYAEVVFRETLYPFARVLRPLLALRPGYFKADHELVADAARLTRTRDFDSEAMDFLNQPSNRWFPRRVLKLRVSTFRLRQLVRAVLRDGSTQPFKDEPAT